MHALRTDIGEKEVAFTDGRLDSCRQDYLLVQGKSTRQEQALTRTSLAIVLAGYFEKLGWDCEVITNIGSTNQRSINGLMKTSSMSYARTPKAV